MNRYKNKIVIGVMAFFIFTFSFWCWGKGTDDFSDSERRVLAAFPELTLETVVSGEFMEEFENYAMDQFAARDFFRGIKSAAVLGVFGQLDNNGLYLKDGYISKTDYPVQEAMLDYAAEHFQKLYNSYIEGTDAKVYFSIIPDKDYILSKDSNRLVLDYEKISSYMQEKAGYMEYIDISDLLSIEDYYRTDTHWRQEQIFDVAARLSEKMGIALKEEYAINTLEVPFYGVYYGQLALPVAPDTLYYLTSDTLENCVVTSYSTGMPVETGIYNMEKAMGKDAYEIFLDGASPLVVIDNPLADTDRELVVFRDSFAGSLIPLLAEGYQKITLIDTRYIASDMLGNFISIENQDVLFLYSSMLLNSSLGMK